jgi:hypothetical protein
LRDLSKRAKDTPFFTRRFSMKKDGALRKARSPSHLAYSPIGRAWWLSIGFFQKILGRHLEHNQP